MNVFSANRLGRIALLLTAVLALGIAAADARPGRGGSIGSRGANTGAAPPPTATAPGTMNRSAVQPSAATPRPGAAAATSGSRFGGGFGSMLMGGLIGAGLFGLLSGHGLFGGMSGLASMLGLLLQVALIGGVIYLAMSFFRSRSQPAAATAGAGNSMERASSVPPRAGFGGPSVGGMAGVSAASAAPSVATRPLAIVKDDYDAFQSLLARVQESYGREAVDELRSLATPEIVQQFATEIEDNRRNNVHNLVSDTKLLQGDLAEAWSEPGAEYATVAMRFEVLETTVERGTGRIVSGNANVPTETTELWTFVRGPGSGGRGWKLSAIDQAQ